MSEHDRSKSFFPSMGRPSYADPDPPKVIKPRAKRPGVVLFGPLPPPIPRTRTAGLVPDAVNVATGKKADKGGPTANISDKTGILTNPGRNQGSILKYPNGFLRGDFPKDYRPIIEDGYRRVGKKPPRRTRP